MYLSIAFIDFDFTAAFLCLFSKFQNLETTVCLDLEVALPDRLVATHILQNSQHSTKLLPLKYVE